MKITCQWCGKTIAVSIIGSNSTWPPKHTYCCEESIRRWEKKQNMGTAGWFVKLIRSIFRK